MDKELQNEYEVTQDLLRFFKTEILEKTKEAMRLIQNGNKHDAFYLAQHIEEMRLCRNHLEEQTKIRDMQPPVGKNEFAVKHHY